VAQPAIVRIAVLSDLHCHLAGQPLESFLTVGSLRRVRNQHPIEALLHLIGTDPVAATAQVVVVPGDFANRMSQEGFSQAWSYVLEVAAALKAAHVIRNSSGPLRLGTSLYLYFL
jgi:3',5'-cyclic AMP phosphodiesterase CpdA